MNPTPVSPAPVVIDYVVDGPRTAATVAADLSRLSGMAYQTGTDLQFVEANNAARVLASFGNRPRVYHDSLFSLAVEISHDLPLPVVFDDMRVMLRLLDEEAAADGSLPTSAQRSPSLQPASPQRAWTPSTARSNCPLSPLRCP